MRESRTKGCRVIALTRATRGCARFLTRNQILAPYPFEPPAIYYSPLSTISFLTLLWKLTQEVIHFLKLLLCTYNGPPVYATPLLTRSRSSRHCRSTIAFSYTDSRSIQSSIVTNDARQQDTSFIDKLQTCLHIIYYCFSQPPTTDCGYRCS